MLKCQKDTGSTLRPARSLVIHWTRKRIENSACPTSPIASQMLGLLT
jgi:hypothetical protein